MPSNKNPITSVNSGPGRVPANSVDSSALTFPLTGGGELQNHMADPVDAHLAGSIGIPANHPVTGEPLLAVAGGPYDGESVLDALAALKDLLPVRPDRLGFNNAVPNSGIPSWGTALTSAVRGGWTDTTAGPTGIVTKNLISGTGSQTISGTLYPADRGVLALYKTTSSTNPDFTNAGQTTLVAALWLGASPAPAGIPDAAFVEATRGTSQTNYTATNSGIDRFNLIDRLPYLSSYPGSQYTAFASNFAAYQLGKFSTSITLSTGDNDSYLLVHWKETYVSSLSQIQPASLSGNLTAANCYSALPADGSSYDNVVRLNIFSDSSSGAGPTGAAFSSNPAGTVTTTALSGLLHYNSTGLQFDVTATATNLFANSYLTNTNVTGSVPTGYTSAASAVNSDLSAFGGATAGYDLYDASPARLVNDSGGTAFTTASPPGTAAVARFQHPTLGGLGNVVPYPHGSLSLTWRDPFGNTSVVTDTRRYLYCPSGAEASTVLSEAFNSETYRYQLGFSLPNAAAPIVPASAFPSSSALGAPVANEGDLQVVSGRLVYPTVDYTATTYRPVNAGRDYSLSGLSDVDGSTRRRYIRAFDANPGGTTGVIRLTGLALAAFRVASDVSVVDEFTDHPGGCVIQLRAAGGGAWADLGRQAGNADGCFTGSTTSGGELVVSYQLPGSAGSVANNGSGAFPLFIRITFLSTATGRALTLDKVRWTAS